MKFKLIKSVLRKCKIIDDLLSVENFIVIENVNKQRKKTKKKNRFCNYEWKIKKLLKKKKWQMIN